MIGKYKANEVSVRGVNLLTEHRPLFSFLLKGLLRDRSRSLFPVLMVASGVFLTVFLHCWIQGVFIDFVKSTAQFDTGHVKITTVAYKEQADQMPNDLALLEVGDLLEELRTTNGHLMWVPRIRFGGMLDIPDEHGETRVQGPVIGMGVDLLNPSSDELTILNLKDALVKGRLPRQQNEILISEEFATRLNIALGETATLLSSTMHGSMTMHNFKVAGIIRFGITALDRGTIITDIDDARFALDMFDGASEILGYSREMIYYDQQMQQVAKHFNKKHYPVSLVPGKHDHGWFAAVSYPDALDKPETKLAQSDKYDFAPVMTRLHEQEGLGEYLDMGKTFGGIIVAMFVFAMSLVLWNSGLINGIRRYGEIGVRLAMGEAKGNLYRSMIAESVIIGIIGSVVGTFFALIIAYYLQYVGIDFGDMMQKSTVLIKSEMRTRVTALSYFIGFLPGVLASVIGTMFAGIGIYRRQTSQLFKELEV